MIFFMVIWSLCWALSIGWWFGFYVQKHPSIDIRSHAADAFLMSVLACLLGPLGLLATFFMTEFARGGWKFPSLKV